MQKGNRGFLVALIGIVVVAALGYGLYGWLFAEKPAAPTPPPPAVNIVEVAPADLPLTYEYAGRTAGSREVEIRARVSGILLKRTYIEGQSVNQGDLLFTIDPAPFEATLAQAQARLTQTERDWTRAQSLIKAKALSPREYDEAKSAYEQARAEVKTARINLDYTTVTAPIGGVTSKESLSEGSLVTADSSLLTRIAQLDPAYVDFSIPDSEALNQRQNIAAGIFTLPPSGKLSAEVHLGSGHVIDQKAEVDFTDSVIDTQTGTVRARAVLPNAGNQVLPGQFVRVVITGLTRKDAITIPDTAIMQGPMGPFVYLVNEEGKAAIAPVGLGGLSGDLRIIESGLSAGDRVITQGMIKVRPDAPVTIEEPKAPDAPATDGQAPAADAKE